MPLISTHDLCVRYGSKIALDSLSLDVPEGSVGLLGPNGAGKSTLLKTLLGFLTAQSGSAEVMGVDCRRDPMAIRSLIGLMPEQDCHIPGMTGLGLVSYAGELCGMPPSQAIRRGHEVLEYCGLGDARYRKVDTYSTGMLQRVKLAQALVHGPQMLLLDEPTNGLDPKGREQMLQLVYDIWHKFKVNVVLCSHLLPDVERVCETVLVMQSGKLIAHGSIDELRGESASLYQVELDQTNEAILSIWKREGIAISQTIGSGRFQLKLPECSQPGLLLYRCANEAGLVIREVVPAKRSLEDVFMEAMQ